MSKINKLVRYDDNKAEAVDFLDSIFKNRLSYTSENSDCLFDMISLYVKKAVKKMYIDEDDDMAIFYMATAETIAFLYNMICPGDLMDKDINEDERVKKLTNGETLTDNDYQYLVSLYTVRAVKDMFEKRGVKFKKNYNKLHELAIKWILNPGEEADSSTNATEDSER